jgi:hypothetical protein
MPAPSRSLADDIRGRTDDELIELVLARPDLARPTPADLTGLAARASTRASVQRALEALDLGRLQVIEALVVAGQVEGTSLLDLLGVSPADPSERGIVAAAVDDLWTRALVWRDGEAAHVVRTVPHVLGASIAGLGPPRRDLRPAGPRLDVTQLRSAIDDAPGPARAILDRLAWGPATAVPPSGAAGQQALRWLVEHDLLVATESNRVVLPREVGLALRGGRLHREPQLGPPELPTRDLSAAVVDTVAGGAASDLLVRVEELASTWGAEPPRVLRGGGLSQRDLRVTGDSLDLPPERAAFLIELAYAAELVGDDAGIAPVWAPTADLDLWSASATGDRWARLARAWLASTRAPHLVGKRVADAPVNALGPAVQWPGVRGVRLMVLSELALLPAGHAPTADDLRQRLVWRQPLRSHEQLAEAVDAVLREAEWLGVTGRGALSSAGRALLHAAGPTPALGTAGSLEEATRSSDPGIPSPDRARSDDPVAATMAAHLPDPIDHILLQADLTAVAPGPLVGDLATFLRLGSELESRGGATVHRFTPTSIRRALDAGWTADTLLDMLHTASRTPVPQPLEYLVTDVARQHGRTRVGGCAAYIRSDDPATLDRMLAARELAAARLRRIAPTVIVSPADPVVLLEMLRDHGFAPVAEGSDGAVVVTETVARRARALPRHNAPVTSVVDEAFTRELVAALRAGEATAERRRVEETHRDGPAIPATDPVVTLAVLRDAMADRHGVWIGVTDRLGATTRHLVHPRRIEGGRVWATDEAGHEQSWSVHRITGATVE